MFVPVISPGETTISAGWDGGVPVRRIVARSIVAAIVEVFVGAERSMVSGPAEPTGALVAWGVRSAGGIMRLIAATSSRADWFDRRGGLPMVRPSESSRTSAGSEPTPWLARNCLARRSASASVESPGARTSARTSCLEANSANFGSDSRSGRMFFRLAEDAGASNRIRMGLRPANPAARAAS